MAFAPELADGHELDQRRVAALLEDQRSGIRGRPVARTRGPIGRALELLAPMDARAVGPTRGRLDRDGGALGGLPQAAGETRPRHGAVGGVKVSILELGRANGRDRDEAGELVGEEIAVAGGLLAKAVLELDLDWSGSGG